MMAYLGVSPEPRVCTMDFVEYVNPATGEVRFDSSSCPPEGFVRVGSDQPKPIIRPEVRMTPQEIERYVRGGTETPQTGGALALAALAALVLFG